MKHLPQALQDALNLLGVLPPPEPPKVSQQFALVAWKPTPGDTEPPF